ncbi:MAG: hypothetical protein P4L53_01150 [Candidatus Obscuribacterales bacterium]|nr:hypothetical protein [Candidatus Obscuribacterales bacterium]
MNRSRKFYSWFLEGMKPSAPAHKEHKSSWYNVMCLTGVDYFASLGYAPGIAALAAGVLAPSATLVLVFLTIFGALPMYKKVAEKSPHGQGSISMLATMIPGWPSKVLILVLIGFAATDFIITITLSAADAAAHIAQNSYVVDLCHQHTQISFLQDRMVTTSALLAVLCTVFLIGFKEAILVAVIITWSYLLLNLGVAGVGIYQIFLHPNLWGNWHQQLWSLYKTPLAMTLQSLIIFPQLALGMSGFETGVAVMPLVEGDATDSEADPAGRIRNTRKLLTAAAITMSTFLLTSSLITTMLIPQADFQEGGVANGRALSYIAHQYLGSVYGSLYDTSTIFILWFSGASSLAGLLSLVPRYLPKFGMAPMWARATRPLVMFFGAVSFVVTYIFKANVDAQGGAYATGVLVLMSSAALACVLVTPKQRHWQRLMFSGIFLVFAYTTVMNVIQRPEGIHIAMFFIGTIFVISFISRAVRSTELRTRRVNFDETADEIIKEFCGKTMHIILRPPGSSNYHACAEEAREKHYLDVPHLVFLEVTIKDASDFSEEQLTVNGREDGSYYILSCESPAVPNAIAAVLLALKNRTHAIPNAYMYWTEGNPLFYVLKYLFLGEGETAPVTREILREAESNPHERPRIHVA